MKLDLKGREKMRVADHAVVSIDPAFATPSTATPVTTDGDVFTLNPGEPGFIQNLKDTAVYGKFGTGASSTSFHFVLKACTADNDGTGGSIQITNYTGVVSIAAASGSPRVAAWKLS